MKQQRMSVRGVSAEGTWTGKRACKDFVREQLFVACKLRLKNVVLMPGVDVACAKLLFDYGVITKQTNLFCFEKVPSLAQVVRHKLQALGCKSQVFGLAEATDPEELFKGIKLDLCYLDWCGPVTARRYKFLRRLSPFLPVGSYFAATTIQTMLGQKFYCGMLGSDKAGVPPLLPPETQKLFAGLAMRSERGGQITRLNGIIPQHAPTVTNSLALYGLALQRSFNLRAMFSYRENELKGKSGGLRVSSFCCELGRTKTYAGRDVADKLAVSVNI